MPLANELLVLATRLLDLDSVNPDQATLRRAVSTVYYALFHLMISEATLNWGRAEHRAQLGRLFEHGNMRKASERLLSELRKKTKSGNDSDGSDIERQLAEVAEAFVTAQQARLDADYVTSRIWRRADALAHVEEVAGAFETWTAIRAEPAAQAYLVSMLGK